MTIFDQARNSISRYLVERVCQSPGAYWSGDDYWCLAPHRADSSVGSFHISAAGLWHDFSTDEGGDLIDLICKRDGCDKVAAAKALIVLSGQTPVDDREQSQAKKKPEPVLPIPATASPLKHVTQSDNAKNRHGVPVGGWTYRNAHGEPLFHVVRFDKPDGSKDVIPYYYGTDAKWHEGQALKSDRPLYHLPELLANPDLPVLVVEGEKCADIVVPGYVVVTWSGGSAAVKHTDWSPLAERVVVVWPDADEPGVKAAAAVKARLPHARVLNVGVGD